jgi:hypothetical protein
MTKIPAAIPQPADPVEPLRSGPVSRYLAVTEEVKSSPESEALPLGMAAQAAAEKRLAYVKGLLAPYRLSPLY